MSTLSSISGFSLIRSAVESATVSPSASSPGSNSAATSLGLQSFVSQQLESQGITGSQLTDLQAEIQRTVQSLQISGSGPVSAGTIHSTINGIIQSVGNTSSPTDSNANASRGTVPNILSNLGVNPSQFQSALSNAITNSGTTGNLDLSHLFSSAGVGSQVDVLG